MTYIQGVNLLPATGEWTYDVVAHRGRRVEEAEFSPLNLYFAPQGRKTDLEFSIDQLQARFPGCGTIALVVAWFADSTDAGSCRVYPSTTYVGGAFESWDGSGWAADEWRCSGLTQLSPDVVPISSSGGAYVYGGTPSDASIARCLTALKARGFRVVFYPFLLMDAPGFPWRGRIGFSGADKSQAAADAVARFFGGAAPSAFSRDAQALRVDYAGATDDFSYRRMILHYAHLCVVAGGVDLFLLGSELRGLEAIRGPAWTRAGTTDVSGAATWDYPFVAGLRTLAADVRSIFDGAGLARDTGALRNLVSYAADWSSWTGAGHADDAGFWPHLDALWGDANVDLVCFDNYLPLSDWTTEASGGQDALDWSAPAPSAWPPALPAGLGLPGEPTLRSKDYFKANIEGGERFHWYYEDGAATRGADPGGTGLVVSRPQGDRLAQARKPYYAGQEILAQKQARWWWKNAHRAVYDAGDGRGWTPQGAATAWAPKSKSVTFTEYGFPTCDRATNQPNVFFDAKSSESATPYWSRWRPVEGGGYAPVEDAGLALLALQAVHEYWMTDAHNETSGQGVRLIEPAFMSAWCWDARPFPTFPSRGDVWGDAGNWSAGNWIGGKGPFIAPAQPDPPAPAEPAPRFPELDATAWSVRYRPGFETALAEHVSGRASSLARFSAPRLEIELVYDRLAGDGERGLAALAGFFDAMRARAGVFLFPVPEALGVGSELLCRFADDRLDLEEFMTRLWKAEPLTLVSVKP
ncbi:glycoside hydrolase TIM-barrel-like domain-containing protein [Methylocella sp.]|uniref:baseplate megatron protein TIM-barrel domain-containing protein n=1 Tax=Methylocella sp. TaxID=1978226 RepID=UPI003783F562